MLQTIVYIRLFRRNRRLRSIKYAKKCPLSDFIVYFIIILVNCLTKRFNSY